jgi:membrane protease YdiL (CAAX protease family)
MLSSLLAYALWQKLQNELPYLLDPTEAPPPALVVADGVVAAMGFFVLQSLLLLLFQALEWPLAKAVTLAFFGAGATVSLLTVAFYFHTRLPRLVDALGLRRPGQPKAALAAVVTGALAGLGAAAFALAYVRLVVPNISFLREASERAPNLLTGGDFSSRVWLVGLTVIAAPVFEEFIFRGVLFAGFRRSFGTPLAAFASAVVFALVHPPVAAPVVFLMALGAAFVYERWRWLGAPIATHCVYNGIVVLAALR